MLTFSRIVVWVAAIPVSVQTCLGIWLLLRFHSLYIFTVFHGLGMFQFILLCSGISLDFLLIILWHWVLLWWLFTNTIHGRSWVFRFIFQIIFYLGRLLISIYFIKALFRLKLKHFGSELEFGHWSKLVKVWGCFRSHVTTLHWSYNIVVPSLMDSVPISYQLL